jgi:hypothetical protein
MLEGCAVDEHAASGGEKTFRFNNRKDMNDGERCDLAVRQIVG